MQKKTSAQAHPFAEVHRPVLEGRNRAIYVAHRTRAEWFVGGSGFTDAEPADFERVALKVLRKLDPSVRRAPRDGTIVLHAEVEVRLNEARPDSAVLSCATGVGASIRAAATDAAEAWARTEAPPFLSLLHQGAVLDAEWFPDGDSLGVPGWDLFSSPYVFRGADADTAAVTPIVQGSPPILMVRDRLAADLPREVVFHAVSILLGEVGGQRSAECRVDGVKVEQRSAALLGAPWTSRPLEWAMMRQLMFLIRSRDPTEAVQ